VDREDTSEITRFLSGNKENAKMLIILLFSSLLCSFSYKIVSPKYCESHFAPFARILFSHQESNVETETTGLNVECEPLALKGEKDNYNFQFDFEQYDSLEGELMYVEGLQTTEEEADDQLDELMAEFNEAYYQRSLEYDFEAFCNSEYGSLYPKFCEKYSTKSLNNKSILKRIKKWWKIFYYITFKE
jgi:hypothetical protein